MGYFIAFLVILLLVALWSSDLPTKIHGSFSKKSKNSPPPPRIVAREGIQPAPRRIIKNTRTTAVCMSGGDIYAYPKCPYCRKRNERGKKQEVFRDAVTGYQCSMGHTFTGKEL